MTGPHGRKPMPRPVKVTSVLLYLMAGLSLVGFVGALVLLGSSEQGSPGLTAEEAGQAFASLLPGIAAVVLGVLLSSGRRGIWWAVLVLSGLMILLALGNLGAGDPRGILQLMLPIAMVILMSQQPARSYFQRAT